MKKYLFKGAGVAIVTPMNDDFSVNYEKLAELLEFQIENETDSIIICGTTGESATMTDKEQLEVIGFTVKHVNKRIPVIAGTGSNNTQHAVEMAIQAEKIGVDGLLVVTPYYNKTSQKGLVSHYIKIADSVDIPIILYNVPSRTGMSISVDTYKILSQHKNIVATKEASGDISLIAQIKAECGEKLDIYSGNDDQIVPVLSLGGIGVISVLSNILPKETHNICKYYFDGGVSKSRDLALSLLEVTNSLFIDVNPVPAKQALNIMGFDVGGCRLPLEKMSDENIKKLEDIMIKAKVI